MTLLWQEPVTALIASHEQSVLKGQLRHLEVAGPSAAEIAALGRLPSVHRRVAYLANTLRARLHVGQAAGRLRIPSIGLNMVVVDGTTSGALRKGPGIYGRTAFPGVSATTAIAGHRTTYLAPFRHIDQLRPGATIDLRMPYADFRYIVRSSQVVKPDALWILRNQGYDQLVLSACAPLFSASHRIVVFARLETVVADQSFVEPRTTAVKHRRRVSR